MKTAFIDFEVYDSTIRTSVCEVGILKYKDGKKMGEFHSLINPNCEPNDWAKRHLTHICKSDVDSAPTIVELWEELRSFIGDSILVCHNVSADINYIYNIEKLFCLTPLYNNGYIDTQEVCKKVIGVSGCYEALSVLTGKNRKDNHIAIEDAKTCSDVFIALQGKTDMIQWIHKETYLPAKEKETENRRNTSLTIGEALIFSDNLLTVNFSFEDKTFCISGLDETSKSDLTEELVLRGGKKRNGISGTTNILITNNEGKLGPSKYDSAKRYQQEQNTGLLVFHEFAVRNWMNNPPQVEDCSIQSTMPDAIEDDIDDSEPIPYVAPQVTQTLICAPTIEPARKQYSPQPLSGVRSAPKRHYRMVGEHYHTSSNTNSRLVQDKEKKHTPFFAYIFATLAVIAFIILCFAGLGAAVFFLPLLAGAFKK